MVDVLNPFGRALAQGIDLNSLMAKDPESGGEALDRLCEETRVELDGCAAGVRYRLVGAEPRYCTPMQYGGFYLERDRELLAGVKGEVRVELVVEGDEAYLDFVSDLPAARIIHRGEAVHA